MLTADHVRARRRGHELRLMNLSSSDEAQALDFSSRLLVIFERSLNKKRAELEEELNDLVVPPRLLKVVEGLKKLLFDRSSFESLEELNPIELRALVFQVASKQRAELTDEQRFDRSAALISAASQLELDIYKLDDVLFSDLKGEQRLKGFDKLHPQMLFEEYKLAQEQAVLLRASALTVRVSCQDPSTYRYLFRQLKFRRLLFEVNPLSPPPEGPHQSQARSQDNAIEDYEIKISGPHNLFRASTKYGLQLALMLPALRVCDRWQISAQVHWGKERTPLDFYLDHTLSAATPKQDVNAEVDLPSEVESLLNQLKKHKSQWRARRSAKIIRLPDVGLCVPDLVLSHPERRERVYFEVMGYWSRDSVWRRIELVEAGVSERIIFAVSSRLRVSERALDQDLPSALLVYKGAILVNRLVELLDRLVPPPAEPVPAGASGSEERDADQAEGDADQS